MQVKEIAELIEIIEKSAIEEFELERSGVRIRVKKKGAAEVQVTHASASPVPVATAAAPAPTPPAKDAAVTEASQSQHYRFKAPIVGTGYLTPKPDAPPFVKVGERISKGTPLCIIEAMKIFNQIDSDVDGVIVRVLFENGQPVEYGEDLFEIELDS